MHQEAYWNQITLFKPKNIKNHPSRLSLLFLLYSKHSFRSDRQLVWPSWSKASDSSSDLVRGVRSNRTASILLVSAILGPLGRFGTHQFHFPIHEHGPVHFQTFILSDR